MDWQNSYSYAGVYNTECVYMNYQIYIEIWNPIELCGAFFAIGGVDHLAHTVAQLSGSP